MPYTTREMTELSVGLAYITAIMYTCNGCFMLNNSGIFTAYISICTRIDYNENVSEKQTYTLILALTLELENSKRCVTYECTVTVGSLGSIATLFLH